MYRLLVALSIVAALSTGAWSQEQSPTVAVLPFVIHGEQDVQQTQRAIQEVLARQMQEEKIRTTEVTRSGQAVQSEDEARNIGRGLHADFVLTGSYSQVGNTISLDARLIDVSGRKRTEIMFAEERGIENLASATGSIVQKMAVHLLSKAVIADVKVQGNSRVESEAIKLNVKSRKGEVLRPDQVREDIKSIFKMGFFEKVDADVSDSPEGKVLTFMVQENPTIQEVQIKGNKKLKEKDILAAMSTRAHTILQKNLISDDVQKIIKLYQQKAYYNAEVTSEIKFPKDPRQAVVTFKIDEKNKVYVKKIIFSGNKHFSARKLRGAMQTKVSNLFSWVTDHGILQRDVLETDADRLTVFYHDKGYMDAKVGNPQADLRKDGFYISIPIEEGERYKVSSVKIAGDKIDKMDKLEKSLKSKTGAYFSRETMREDLDRVTKAYMNQGYAHVEVNPDVQKDRKDLTGGIIFDVKKKEPVRIGKIYITGNTKTRDNVIRREIQLAEGDQFSAALLEMSMTKLKKLDYFEEADITPVDTDQPGIMDLHVKVKEKLTGAVSVGGGFSSEDGLFASGEVNQRNLFGKGQYIGLKAYLGTNAQRYMFSFTEPWMFGRHITGGVDVYNWLRDYPDFRKESTGFRLRAAYPFGRYSRVIGMYTLENIDVSEVSDDSSPYTQSQLGSNIKSSVTVGVERDTTDHPFLPTRGSINALTTETTSKYLGSDLDYLRVEYHTGIYFPLGWKLVGFLRGEVGYLYETDKDNPVPIYERFFLGGINSLRGFEWGHVGPKIGDDYVGGTKYVVTNAEVLFPLIEKIGMRGVVFFDAGNAFLDEDIDISKFRTDVGTGIRWNSPFGPLRIEWGYNLDPEPGEDRYQWQFSAGAFF